jgi:hypothetical protein
VRGVFVDMQRDTRWTGPDGDADGDLSVVRWGVNKNATVLVNLGTHVLTRARSTRIHRTCSHAHTHLTLRQAMRTEHPTLARSHSPTPTDCSLRLLSN